MLIDSPNFSPSDPKGFIVLEGVNGAGKSTLAAQIERLLTARGLAVRKTFEPGATPLGKKLREMLLSSAAPARSSLAELFLFCADRAQHIEEVILPCISKGEVVLSDRYFYSTVAFQGYGRGLSLETVERACAEAIRGILPDLVILLDLDPREGLKRTRARNPSTPIEDSFEKEEIEFHHRLRTGFLTLARSRPEPFLVIDALLSEEDIAKKAATALEPLISTLAARRKS